jgi:hypothetical protein
LTQQRYRASYLAMSENDMPAGKTEEEAPLGQVYDPRALRRTMNEGFLDFDLRFHSTQQRVFFSIDIFGRCSMHNVQ